MSSVARFLGRTAVVTGAGSGIGRTTSLYLMREGCRVIGVDLAEDRIKDFAEQMRGAPFTALVLDVADPDTPAAVLAVAGRPVDVLVNAAAITDGHLPASEVDDDTWQRVLDVDLTAPLRLIRAIVPGMVKAGSGSIVNIGSVAGLRGSAAGAAYTAAKHGLLGLTRSVAVSYGPLGVRCNIVQPGPTSSDLVATYDSEMARERLEPLNDAARQIAPPVGADRVAELVLFLSSPAASAVNGAVIAVDGGWAAL